MQTRSAALFEVEKLPLILFSSKLMTGKNKIKKEKEQQQPEINLENK